jgi:very-short-patch-repair endonuclease
MTSQAELTLAVQLEQAGIPFEREFRFAPPRRWRFDFAWAKPGVPGDWGPLAVEVEGGAFTGGHRRGSRADLDCEKANTAALMGWTVLRFTPAMVDDGRALAVIRQALGLEAAA